MGTKSFILAALFFLVTFLGPPAPTLASPKPDQTVTDPSPSKSSASEYRGVPASIERNEKGVAAVQARDFKKAEQLFSEALTLDPENGTAAVNLAAMLVTNKKSEQAITLLADFTARHPNDAALWARYGDALFSNKKVAEAIKAYERALSIDPKFTGIASRLGTLYALSGRFNDAERLFLQAVEENPRDGQSLAALSNLFLGTGKADRAVSTAKRALQVQPTKELYLTLGSAYELQKDYKNSVIALERARDLGVNDPELPKRIAALRQRTTP